MTQLTVPGIEPLAQHSSLSNEHYTPGPIIEMAREVMGGINVDPASTQRINDSTVRAGQFFDTDSDGLTREWPGNVWLNPPGGRVGRASSASVWWSELCEQYMAGTVTQALFMGFSVELLATTQEALIWPGNVPFCIPRKRIQFLREERPGVFMPGTKPTHANIILFLPPKFNYTGAASLFKAVFSTIGKVRT